VPLHALTYSLITDVLTLSDHARMLHRVIRLNHSIPSVFGFGGLPQRIAGREAGERVAARLFIDGACTSHRASPLTIRLRHQLAQRTASQTAEAARDGASAAGGVRRAAPVLPRRESGDDDDQRAFVLSVRSAPARRSRKSEWVGRRLYSVQLPHQRIHRLATLRGGTTLFSGGRAKVLAPTASPV